MNTKIQNNEKLVLDPCGRCNGTGTIAAYHYIENGVCFACLGTGGEWVTAAGFARMEAAREARAVKAAAAAERKKAAAAAEQEKMKAEVAAFTAAHLDVLPRLHVLGYFGDDLELTLNRKGRLTDAQLDAARTALAAKDAADEAPEGRQEVTGEVLNIKRTTYHRQGRTTVTVKMTVRDNRGFKVHSTVPAAIADALGRGMLVTFTATLAPDMFDKKFARATRPSKASIVA